MAGFEDEIGRQLQQAIETGELRGAASWGKPLPEDIGWNSTPEALRLPMKVLKDAGVLPPEIAWFHERARLRAAVERESDAEARRMLQQRLSELEQVIAMRLEGLRRHASY